MLERSSPLGSWLMHLCPHAKTNILEAPKTAPSDSRSSLSKILIISSMVFTAGTLTFLYNNRQRRSPPQNHHQPPPPQGIWQNQAIPGIPLHSLQGPQGYTNNSQLGVVPLEINLDVVPLEINLDVVPLEINSESRREITNI